MEEAFKLRSPVRSSLFEAASRIESAVGAAAGERWREQAADALRLASSAVETALDDLTGAGGALREAVRDEPRLEPRLRKIEEALSSVLVDVWEAEASTVGHVSPEFAARLQALAGDLRSLASATFDLAHVAAEDLPGGNA